MEVLSFIAAFLSDSWKFFTQVNVPGFDFSFAALFVGIFIASLSLRFVGQMLGISITGGAFGKVERAFRRGDDKNA